MEYLLSLIIRAFGFVIRHLPVGVALGIGRLVGTLGYYMDTKHKSLAYANLKIAFAKTKKPSEIKRIVKKLFQNFGQNFVELLRLPLIYEQGAEKFVKVEGKEHVLEALKKGKGVIILPPHFGSWEITNLTGEILDHPYRVVVKPQKKFSKLDELLNSYRQCCGSMVISRGSGTREIIDALKKNEVVGMVVDQGGKDGALVKFFGREASMSVGAIRLALKFGTPICFAIIIRENGPYHRLIFHPPLDLVQTGNLEHDIHANLNNIIKIMEEYIAKYPSEYVWFYKIWKYSKESATVIINDGKVGHLRQSQAVARMIDTALAERGIHSETEIVDIKYKNAWAARALAFMSFLVNARFCQGRLRYFKLFLAKESFRRISSTKADYVVSCGSSGAGINFILSSDCRAKSVSVLTPGLLGFDRFNLVVLPQHDRLANKETKGFVVATQGAPNLVDDEYLKNQSQKLIDKYPHLKDKPKLRIGVLLGGKSKNLCLNEEQIKNVLDQIKNASKELDAQILLTTSRRTSSQMENLIQRELKDAPCSLLILANQNNIPEAVGGILGLSDIIITSGDSISMVSEAASSGKGTIVFYAEEKRSSSIFRNKHKIFIEQLHRQNRIYVSDVGEIHRVIVDMAAQKIKTESLNDNAVILDAVRQII